MISCASVANVKTSRTQLSDFCQVIQSNNPDLQITEIVDILKKTKSFANSTKDPDRPESFVDVQAAIEAQTTEQVLKHLVKHDAI